ADDILGTLALKAAKKGLDVVIVTGDKDCGQLLNTNIRIYDPRKDLFTTVESFTEKKGIPPEKLIDLMGLWGDSSDNIPGVPGIGEKIGVELINKYGSLEKLLHHAAEIKGKRGEKLRECKELAVLSKELATIKTDVEVELELEKAEMGAPDTAVLREMFTDLGFKSLLRDLEPETARKEEARKYILVDTPDKFKAFIKTIPHEKHLAVDTETTSLDTMVADLVGISISTSPLSGYYLPFRSPEGENALGEEELKQIGSILENPEITKTGQNLKYDMKVLKRAGIELRGIVFDSLIASSIIMGHIRDHGIDTLAKRHLGIEKIPTTDLIGKGAKQVCMDTVPLKQICEYACEDADVALRLEEVLAKQLEKRNEKHLLDDIELPLSLVLAEMEYTGIRIDCKLLKKQSDEVAVVMDALEQQIYALAGHEFNVASPKQLSVILYEEMNLPVLKKTKTGASTDESVLTELAAQGHELPEAILSYRTYAKLKNTYLDALPELVNADTGRIHTTFSQTATATGRLSSRDPNLQNIPVRTEKGRAVRAAFIPENGWDLIAADYSQIELRIFAHFSMDETLLDAFAKGLDIHRVVAAELNDIDEEDVTSEQRSAAKAINFGIIYGKTPHGLSQETGMSLGQAKLFIDSYFERFPKVKDFIEDAKYKAHQDGFVQTIMGRRREIVELKSGNKMKIARAEREAVNTIMQGSAADLIKIAMINLARRMKDEGLKARMLLQIHDELVFESPKEETEALKEMIREEMEGAMNLKAPLMVNIGVGKNWLEAK
ncbi:MAG: DNA polymerase I, partial [Planctomycetes bacterium]|nr:DNA polymerase I [Planctomycetota bacterium]